MKNDDGYSKFQQIMAEINYKIQMEENRKNNKYDLPPGFEDIFRGGFK